MKKLLSSTLFILIFSALFSIYSFAASTSTAFTRVNDKIKCTVSLNEIPENSVIIASAFEDDRLEECKILTVTSNKTEVFYFSTEVSDVKIYVFENLTSFSPIPSGEFVEIIDSIVDKDWSDWV